MNIVWGAHISPEVLCFHGMAFETFGDPHQQLSPLVFENKT